MSASRKGMPNRHGMMPAELDSLPGRCRERGLTPEAGLGSLYENDGGLSLARHKHRANVPQSPSDQRLTNSQPAPLQSSHLDESTSPLPAHLSQGAQSVSLRALRFTPRQRLPPTVRPHEPPIRVPTYDIAPHLVQTAIGFSRIIAASPHAGQRMRRSSG